ncbi:pyroglutamyl-peptidase I [Pseudobdellovibrio sp. HCB154]|uniref:pyroglutamyl-peptidase I family protein n=1 Tax=Pseudobdellovibrio sp. HCB154 TaxID=3386277 RepID=UPI0039176412
MILVSGFKPFLKEKINPSELLVEKLKVKYQDLKTVVLPVEFDRAFVELQKQIEQVKPKFVIMFGQAGGRPNVCLEKIALNWNQTKSFDEANKKPEVGRIGDGELALMSTFPVDDCAEFLADRKLKVETSFSAGAFVCNNLYFKVLKNYPLIPSIFVHVPFLPEQGEVHHPKMDFEQMEKIASEIINFARSRC